MHVHSFLGLQRGLHGQRCENQLQDLCEDTKEAETTNKLRMLGGGKLMLLQQNTRPHTSAATSAATGSVRFEVVPHPPYNWDLVLSEFWLFRAFKTHLKGNRFTHAAEVPSCYGKMVSRTAWKILHWQVWKTCSLLAALFEWEEDYMETWHIERKYTI
jgi:hypothetical protein